MAFKGGTSLTKVFQALNRFSEDVDISLDHRDLLREPTINPFAKDMTNSAKRRLRMRLGESLRELVHGAIRPGLSGAFSEITSNAGVIESNDDGSRLCLHYPGIFESEFDYIGNTILLEFGGRNVTEPSGPHLVRPWIAQHLPAIRFPEARVTALAPERTFWEKATLAHVACHREPRADPNRLSRHWYDLALLARGDIGRRALADRNLLEDVVRHKTVFFDSSHANYDDCLVGKFRLVPGASFQSVLARDYESMRTAGMFEGDVPAFSELLDELSLLERKINAQIG